jgi:hypothetical protein
VQFLLLLPEQSRYQKKTHYYTYDWSSFIADVGGFLGLFMGHSILSFYDTVKVRVAR